MSLRHPVTDEVLKARRLVYEWVLNDFEDRDPPRFWWVGCAKELYLVTQSESRSPETIRKWWDHPEKYSPYIDEVAMDRAFNDFDPKVIRNLSDLEWQTFIEKMDHDPHKPWLEEPPQKGMERRSKRTTGHAVTGTDSWLSDRGRAWFRLSLEERGGIQRAIQTRRERLRKEAEKDGQPDLRDV